MDQPALCRRRLIFQERKTRNLLDVDLDLPKTRTLLVCGVLANDNNDIVCVCVCRIESQEISYTGAHAKEF